MPIDHHADVFGAAARCDSMAEILALITANAGKPTVRRQAAAYGMALAAAHAVGSTHFFENTRHVVDAMARAKAELDIHGWHSAEVVQTTAAILAAVQRFLDETTIPCTEWALPGEVAEMAFQEAVRQAALS